MFVALWIFAKGTIASQAAVIIKEGRNRLATAERSYEQALSAALDEVATDEELRPLLTTNRHRKLPVAEA